MTFITHQDAMVKCSKGIPLRPLIASKEPHYCNSLSQCIIKVIAQIEGDKLLCTGYGQCELKKSMLSQN